MEQLTSTQAFSRFFKIPPGVCDALGIGWEPPKVTEMNAFLKALTPEEKVSLATQAASALGCALKE